MKLPILIIRTVSVEKLAPTIEACEARWPGHPLLVASNEGRAAELATDSRIAAVMVCATGVSGFGERISCPQRLEAVVVPVGNRTGSGYANVLRACRSLDSRTWFLASFARNLVPIAPWRWGLCWRWEFTLQALTRGIAKLWAGHILRRESADSNPAK